METNLESGRIRGNIGLPIKGDGSCQACDCTIYNGESKVADRGRGDGHFRLYKYVLPWERKSSYRLSVNPENAGLSPRVFKEK